MCKGCFVTMGCTTVSHISCQEPKCPGLFVWGRVIWPWATRAPFLHSWLCDGMHVPYCLLLSPCCAFTLPCFHLAVLSPCRAALLFDSLACRYGFWRVMLDEAQMVSNSNSVAAQAASSIWRRHAWVITGVWGLLLCSLLCLCCLCAATVPMLPWREC